MAFYHSCFKQKIPFILQLSMRAYTCALKLTKSGHQYHHLQFSYQRQQSQFLSLGKKTTSCLPLAQKNHCMTSQVMMVISLQAHVHEHMASVFLQEEEDGISHFINHGKTPASYQRSHSVICMNQQILQQQKRIPELQPSPSPQIARIKSRGKLIIDIRHIHVYDTQYVTKVSPLSSLVLTYRSRMRSHSPIRYRHQSPNRQRSRSSRCPISATLANRASQYFDSQQVSLLMQMFEQLQEYLEPEYDEVTSQPPNTLESDTGNLCLTQSCKYFLNV